ncbi:MAG: hypothetical protein KDA24_22800 [Deltaproteobacteria bacterium]|nr:hypothetical protein [Deltaproteobacteria bacterium]
MRLRLMFVLGMALCAVSLSLTGPQAASRAVSFDGVWARAQDAHTMEKGLLRSDLRTLRGMRDRTAVFLIAAPGDRWDREVAPALVKALDADPASFEKALTVLHSDVVRAGPNIEGGQLRVRLDGGGDGLLSVHLPALLSAEQAGVSLTNSSPPNKAHFLAGFELKAGGPGVTKVHVPRGLRPLSRGLPPRVPLVSVEKGATWIALGDDEGSGDDARALRKVLGKLTAIPDLPMEQLRATPRRSASLVDSLRSVRLSGPALATPEGPYRTLTQAPSSWSLETRTVRHPSRYLALGAPVAVVGDEGNAATMVLGVVAFYTPLILTLEEAPLLVGADPKAFAEAVHRGEVPFLREGSELLFYRPWVERWASGGGKKPGGKMLPAADAASTVAGWGERYKLKGLTRASQAPLPLRLGRVPSKEREQLIDSAQVAWTVAWPDDLSAWLKHLEPTLKQGKQKPLWAFDPTEGGLLVDGSFSLPKGAVASSSPSYLSGLGARGGGSGGGAETLRGSAGESRGGGGSSALSVDILDMFSGDAFCPLGRRADAGVEFALDGVAEGQPVALQLEWDLRMGGRSVRMDAFKVRKEAGTHEVDFEVPCPDTAGSAQLEVVLVDPSGAIAAEGTLQLDARAYGGRSFSALRMPSAKQCLHANLNGGDDEFSVATTKGLSSAQVQAAVRGFQEQTLRCYAGGGGNGTVQLEVLVGCDGLVMTSEVMDDTTGDTEFAECIAETFKFAPFPAHDRDGGALFEVPLRYD